MKQRGGIAFDVMLVVGILAALGGLAMFLINIGDKRATERCEAVRLKAEHDREKDMRELEQTLQTTQDDLRVVREERDLARKNYQTERRKRLHEFIPQNALSASCITVGFVRYHDAAAAGVPLGVRPEPGVAEAPAGFGTDAAAEVIGRNYDKYHDCRAKVAGILEEFDSKKAAQNTVVNRINQRIQRAERKVQ